MHTTLHGRIKAVWLAQEHHAALLKALDQRKERIWCYHTLSQRNSASQECCMLDKGCRDVPVLPFSKKSSLRPVRNIHLLDHRTGDHRITEGFGLKGTFKNHVVQGPCHEQDINGSISMLQQECWQATHC